MYDSVHVQVQVVELNAVGIGQGRVHRDLFSIYISRLKENKP